MVGDRLDIDIAGAKLAGMKTIRIKKGKYAKMKPSKEDEKPDYEIKEFEELLDIL